MKILLVEDDEQIGPALVTALSDHHYAVNWAKDGESGLHAALHETYDFVVLDLGLPKVNGIEILKSIRKENTGIPIIIITARDQIEDRVLGLDNGADDYLVKPFFVNELLTRLRALLRRTSGNSSSSLEVGELCLDLNSFKVKKGLEEYELTQKEFALLRIMMTKKEKVFSKAELEEHLYGWEKEVSSNAVEFTIHGIRKKVGKEVIKNIRGLGWMIKS